jgi:hypothetical protein
MMRATTGGVAHQVLEPLLQQNLKPSEDHVASCLCRCHRLLHLAACRAGEGVGQRCVWAALAGIRTDAKLVNMPGQRDVTLGQIVVDAAPGPKVQQPPVAPSPAASNKASPAGGGAVLSHVALGSNPRHTTTLLVWTNNLVPDSIPGSWRHATGECVLPCLRNMVCLCQLYVC